MIILSGAVIIWLTLFSNFISGRTSIAMDTLNNYTFFKFFYNSLFNGAIPLWNPFYSLGLHFLGNSMHGILTPTAMFGAAWKMAGFDYYQMYIIFITGTFLLGIIGFYSLSKEILKSNSCALLAAVMLLFSGFGPMVFNQINIILIFTPSVWFLTLSLRFLRSPSLSKLIGAVFFILWMSVSYLPFHLLTFLLILVPLSLCIYADRLNASWTRLAQFARPNWTGILMALTLLAIGLLPVIINARVTGNGEYVFPARHAPITLSINQDKGPGPQMSYLEIDAHGTMGERMPLGNFLAHLDQLSYLSDDCWYLPCLVYLLIALGVLTAFDRARTLMLSTGTILYLFSLGSPGHIFPEAYELLPIFKLFRNYFYFTAFLMPLMSLFAAAQAKALAEYLISRKTKIVTKRIGIITVFTLFCLWAINQGPTVLQSSWITITGCFMVIWGMVNSNKANLWVKILLLGLIGLIEPVNVLHLYSQHASSHHVHLPSLHVNVKFSYTRPSGMDPQALSSIPNSNAAPFWYDMTLTDSNPDIARFTDIVNSSIYRYYLLTDPQEYALSTRHKFFLNSVPVDHAAPQLDVAYFDPNTVKLNTNLPAASQLIYTDAYSRYWQASINGHPAEIIPVHGAFKSITVPAGEATVNFIYSPPLGIWPTVIYMGLMCVLSFWLLLLSWRVK